MISYRNPTILRNLLCACAISHVNFAFATEGLSVDCSKSTTETVKTSKKLVELNKLPQAELCLRQFLKLSPKSRDLGFYLVRVIAWQKKYEAAISEYKKWKSTDSESLSLLGDIYWYQGNSAKASRAYSSSFKKRTTSTWPEDLWQRSIKSSLGANKLKRAKFFISQYKTEHPQSSTRKDFQNNYSNTAQERVAAKNKNTSGPKSKDFLSQSPAVSKVRDIVTTDLKYRTENHIDASKPDTSIKRDSSEFLINWAKKFENITPWVELDFIEKNFGNDVRMSDSHLKLGYLFEVDSLGAPSEIIIAAGPNSEFTYRYLAEAGLGYGVSDTLKTEFRLRQTSYKEDSTLLVIAGITNYSGPTVLILRLYSGQAENSTYSLLTRLLYQLQKFQFSTLVSFGNEDASRPEKNISSSDFYTAGIGVKYALDASVALASSLEYRAEVDQKDFSQTTGGASVIWTF